MIQKGHKNKLQLKTVSILCMKILKYLFLLVLFMFPLGELLRVDVGKNIILKPLDLAVFLTVCVYFANLIIKRIELPKTIFTKPLIAFCAIALFSLVINSFNLSPEQLLTAFLYWVRFVAFAAMYFVVLSLDKNSVKKIPAFLFIDGIIILLLGFIQYFLYPNLRNLYYLGWDEHNYRMFSTFLDPNFAGAFFVLYILLTVGLAQHYLKQIKAKQAVLIFIVSVLTVVSIFLTYSRSAILMLVASTTSYLVLVGKKKFLLVLFGAVAIIIILLSPSFNTENTNLFRTTSSFARLETYSNSVKIIKDRPFFGIGFNAYRYAQQSYGFRKDSTKFPSHADAGADNSFLFVAATTGIIGLGAYLFLWYSILKRAINLYNKNNNMFALIVICSSVGLFINSFFINSLFFPAIMLWIWTTIALMDRQ